MRQDGSVFLCLSSSECRTTRIFIYVDQPNF